MFTDSYRLIDLGIIEAHRQADLERSFRRGRSTETATGARSIRPRDTGQAAIAVPAVTNSSAAAPDAALIAAGERSDALLLPACGPCQTVDRAA